MFNWIKNLFTKEEAPVDPYEFDYGVFEDAPDNRDIMYEDVLDTYTPLPEKFFNDIDDIVPVDQRRLGACVGHAGGHLMQQHEDRKRELSARYAYAVCKSMDGRKDQQGTYTRLLGKVFTERGIADEREVDNNSRLSHEDYIDVDFDDKDVVRNASKRKRKGYAFVNVKDRDAIKRAIVNEGGLVMSMRVGNWKGKYLYPDFPNSDRERRNSRHLVYVYGYDGDTFYILNSWGKRWGYYRNGTGRFHYDDYRDDLFLGMTFSDKVTPKKQEEARSKKYIFTRSMYYGIRRYDVIKLQERLNAELGMKIPTTGYFGSITKGAVMVYQYRNGLVVDGWVGRLTLNKLNA